MLKITRPNGDALTLPARLVENVVLELHGGGVSEEQVFASMADSALVHRGELVEIKGWKLQLTEEKEHDYTSDKI